MQRAMFVLADDGIGFVGYHLPGRRWNGWAVPWFDADTVRAIATAWRAEYDGEDSYQILETDDGFALHIPEHDREPDYRPEPLLVVKQASTEDGPRDLYKLDMGFTWDDYMAPREWSTGAYRVALSYRARAPLTLDAENPEIRVLYTGKDANGDHVMLYPAGPPYSGDLDSDYAVGDLLAEHGRNEYGAKIGWSYCCGHCGVGFESNEAPTYNQGRPEGPACPACRAKGER